MKTRLLIGVALILVLAMVVAAADDPFVGTWKWISSIPPEALPVGSWWTARIEIKDNGYHIIQDGVISSDGKTLHLESTDILDGKEHPLTGNPAADVTTAKRIDMFTYETVSLKNGVEVVHMRFSVSKDGKTLEIFRQSKSPLGDEVKLARLMTRQ